MSDKGVDIVIGDISDDLKKQMRDKIPNDPTKTMGFIFTYTNRY